MPNGKFIRWNNNGQSYIGDSNNNLSQFANYSEIININNSINKITGDFILLGTIVQTYTTSLTQKTMTLPHSIFEYDYILINPLDTTYGSNSSSYEKIQPFNLQWQYTSQQSNMTPLLIRMCKPTLCIVAWSNMTGYGNASYKTIIITNGYTNTNIISFYCFQCNVAIYGHLA